MIGNLLFLANKFNEMSRLFLSRWIPDVISGQDVLLILIGQVALIFGYMAIFRLYTRHAGGMAGLRWACFAAAASCWRSATSVSYQTYARQ